MTEFSTNDNLTLLTDLYEITMAQGYWATGKAQAEACFYVFFRDYPFKGGYAIACGMAQIAELLENWSITDEDVAYLQGLQAPGGGPLFEPEFLSYLKDMELTVDIDAVEEGTVVFPVEPLVRVTGPIIQCQLLETALLNCVNFETLIATKAARVCREAEGPVAEFGLRRAQGPNGGLLGARAAVIGGCASTSNVLAGERFGIPVSGTHAHSWVMSFDSELEAFREYARISPKNCCLLVDTYDVVKGVENAIIVAKEMQERGEKLSAIRIDSGDLAWLSQQARKMLDDAGFPDVGIVASNDLDEYTISSLKAQGACINSWGVGTKLITAYDQAALGGVYKLCAFRSDANSVWEPRLKVSGQTSKMTLPGILDVRRYVDDRGVLAGDMIFDTRDEPAADLIIDPFSDLRQKDLSAFTYELLLKPLARKGHSVLTSTDAMEAQARAKADLARLDATNKRLLNPHTYPVGLSKELRDRRNHLVKVAKGIQDEGKDSTCALIVVDLQKDFCEGGSLAVEGGNAIVPKVNDLIKRFQEAGALVVATRDLHPANHGSFVDAHPGTQVGDVVDLSGLEQIVWPAHCVEGTEGAEFHSDLVKAFNLVVDKGVDADVDSYSAFFDNARRRDTGLGDWLKERGVESVWVCGLATDYCVRMTAEDALDLGYQVTLVADATAAVNANPGDYDKALEELAQAGCSICSADEVEL